jgi:hypothetical protein
MSRPTDQRRARIDVAQNRTATKATPFRIILWRCSAQSEHGIAPLGTVATHSREAIAMVNNSSGGLIGVLPHFWYFLEREDFRMVNYQTIAELVSQIPVDTWNLLREIKQRRPAMMLSELID